MQPDGFSGIAVFLVLAVLTGVICYLAMLQSKVKKQVEESRKQRERDELAPLGGTYIPATPTDLPPSPAPDATPESLPKITPGGTPPPQAGGPQPGRGAGDGPQAGQP